MGRGRPPKSMVRQNIIELMYVLKRSSGYDIYKVYREVFPQVTLRSIYYHLKKGLALGEFEIESIRNVKGACSWGSQTEKIFYRLGKNANPTGDPRVKRFLETGRSAV